MKNNAGQLRVGLFEVDLGLNFVSPSTDPDDTSVNDDPDTSEVTTCNGGDPNTSEPPIDDIDESIIDDNEEQLVEKWVCEQFVLKTYCYSDGKPCSYLFSVQNFT